MENLSMFHDTFELLFRQSKQGHTMVWENKLGTKVGKVTLLGEGGHCFGTKHI